LPLSQINTSGPGGRSSMRDSTCSMGMFTAPATCPVANSAAERTSSACTGARSLNPSRKLSDRMVAVILSLSIGEERILEEKDSGGQEFFD